MLDISLLHKNSLLSPCLSGPSITVPPHNDSEVIIPSVVYSLSYLLVREAGHRVDVLLLDHEGSQVGSVGGQEDDSKEGPHRHHDLTGGTLGILHRDGVVENQTPEQPDGLTDGERGAAGLWE